MQIKNYNLPLVCALFHILSLLLASGLNPLQQLIFIEVEFLTSFVSRNQSFTRKRE